MPGVLHPEITVVATATVTRGAGAAVESQVTIEAEAEVIRGQHKEITT
jgi:hypothetical protein